MTKENEKLIKLHKENGYFINITGLKNKSGCSVNFPSNFLFEKPLININYKYVITPKGIDIYCFSDNKMISETEFECDERIKRILIYQDITLKRIALGISHELMEIKDENDKAIELKNFLDILKAPKDTKVEKLLKQFFTNILKGKTDKIEGLDKDLEDVMLQVIENGGF